MVLSHGRLGRPIVRVIHMFQKERKLDVTVFQVSWGLTELAFLGTQVNNFPIHGFTTTDLSSFRFL